MPQVLLNLFIKTICAQGRQFVGPYGGLYAQIFLYM